MTPRPEPLAAARRLARAAALPLALAALPLAGSARAQAPTTPPAGRVAPTTAELAGDTARHARALVARALQAGDLEALQRAAGLARAMGRADRTRMLLAYERLLRQAGAGAAADSALVTICRSACAALVNDDAALVAALHAELGNPAQRAYGAGVVQRAVRTLVAREALGEPTLADATALGLSPAPDAAVAEAADSAVARGRRDDAAELHLAAAYVLLPATRFVGAGADARRALDEARASLALRRADDDAGRARALGLAGMALLRMERLDSAATLLREAERLAEAGPVSLRALLRRRRAVVAATAGDTAAAARLLAEALAMRSGGAAGAAGAYDRQGVARALVTSGAGAAARREATLAWAVLRDSADVETRGELAVTVAEAYRLAGDADSSARWFRVAADAFTRVALDERAGHVLAAMAEDALERGRVGAARALLDEAAAAARRLPAGDAGLGARLLNDHAWLAYALGDPGAARESFTLARRLAPATHPEFHEAQRGLALLAATDAPRVARGADATTVLAELARQAGGAALPVSVALAPGRPPVRALSGAWLHTAAAAIHLERGALPAAWAQLGDALALLDGTADTASLRRAQGAMSELHAKLGRADSAAFYRALASGARPEAGPAASPRATTDAGLALRAELRALPAAESLRRLRALLAGSRAAGDHLGEARALGALGFHHLRRRAPADPATATAYHDSAFVALRAFARQPRAWSERAKAWVDLPDWYWVQLAEQTTLLQGEAVLAWLARAPEIGAERAALGALAAADRGRGQAFATLARGRGVIQGGIVGDIIEGALWSRNLPEVGAELLDDPLVYGSGTASLSYVATADTLVVWLRTPAAGAGRSALRVSRRAIGADSLAALVSRARAAIGADSAATRAVPALEPATPAAAATRGIGLRAARQASGARALRALAAALLPPELVASLGATPELLVIAGGPIAAVPFAALPVDSAGTPLGRTVAVRYAPSLVSQQALMRAARAERLPAAGATDSARASRRAWLARAVVLGNPRMPAVTQSDGTRRALAPLPGAEAEARAVASLLGVEPLVGEAAALDALRGRAERATVVHLATHGYAFGTEARVGDSFVALAPAAGDDGLLTVTELLADGALRLPRAELVVLSACQTGLGQLTSSEGTLGLQRAFLASGAESVLVSLWSVSDEATALLLSSFYRHWLQDADAPGKAEALRRAQDDVRARRGFEDPQFWAAFQLVGAG